MASFKQLKLFIDKEVDQCLQNVVRPFTEYVFFPETPMDPLETESRSFRINCLSLFFHYVCVILEHHQEIQLQNLAISDTLACATCQIQFTDRTEQVSYCQTRISNRFEKICLDTSF